MYQRRLPLEPLTSTSSKPFLFQLFPRYRFADFFAGFPCVIDIDLVFQFLQEFQFLHGNEGGDRFARRVSTKDSLESDPVDKVGEFFPGIDGRDFIGPDIDPKCIKCS